MDPDASVRAPMTIRKMKLPLLQVTASAAVSSLVLSATVACDGIVIIGARFCPQAPEGDAGEGGAVSTMPDPDASVVLPWSTGFEDGFCDYASPTGFCLEIGSSSITLATSPVHSGQYAAEYTVDSAPDGGGSEARCVEEGVFPPEAYFGAWYYVPNLAQNSGVWNLFHFASDVPLPNSAQFGRWDVSLINLSDGGPLYLVLYDFVNSVAKHASSPIPIGQWFHLEVYFKAAKDTTGQLQMLFDGLPVVTMTGIPTLGSNDTGWGQWFVGNYATALLPPLSTVYVDDITIGLTP